MAKTVTTVIKLQVPAGGANPSPPDYKSVALPAELRWLESNSTS